MCFDRIQIYLYYIIIFTEKLLSRDYSQYEVKEAMERMGGLLPMNIFLRQEISRMQKVKMMMKSE